MSILAYKKRLSRLEEVTRKRQDTRLPIRERIQIYDEIFSLQDRGEEIPEKYIAHMGVITRCGKYNSLFACEV